MDLLGQLVQSAFGGAYYRKVTSAEKPEYFGLRGEGKLPLVTFDKTGKRYFEHPSGRNHFKTGPMDRPSVYFGGHANGKELDCGLSWDRVWKTRDVPTFTDLDAWCCGGDLKRRFTIQGGKVTDGLGELVDELNDEDLRRKYFPNFAFRPFWRTTNSFEKKLERWHTIPPEDPKNIYFCCQHSMLLGIRWHFWVAT